MASPAHSGPEPYLRLWLVPFPGPGAVHLWLVPSMARPITWAWSSIDSFGSSVTRARSRIDSFGSSRHPGREQ